MSTFACLKCGKTYYSPGKIEVRKHWRWNWKNCIPLQVLLWLLAMTVVGVLAMLPMWSWLLRGVLR